MFDFLFRVAVIIVLFILLFSISHNLTPAEVIQKIVEAAKQLWVYILSLFDHGEPMDPSL